MVQSLRLGVRALATLAAAFAAVVFAAPALAADPSHVSFTLEGCRNNGTIVLPNGSGQFICPDSAYTTGNLGKGWNELDLVPHRLTANAGNAAPTSQTYTVAVVLDNQDAGHPGYDVLSAPVLNAAKSSASCAAPVVGAQTPLSPGLGGIDTSIFRLVTINQAKNTTCVYDYFGRLALGSHLFPGSSLHANLADENVSTAGIGARDVSIPVKEILPQELNKDMSATQGTDHVWSIAKQPTPARLDFGDTCDPSAPRSAPVSIIVVWEKLPATPSGPITVVTHVYAKNPASRVITVTVSDDIRSGATVLDTATSGAVDVSANTTQLVLTHTTTVPNGTTDLNDVATATYTDKVTGVPVPGNTTATASAAIQPSGPELNTSAVISDVESISGADLSYSVDSFFGATGSFGLGYVAGLITNGLVSWTSDPQTGSGSVTFAKTVYVDHPTITSGALSDVATVTGSDGFTANAAADIDLQASAQVSLTINKTIPGVLSGSETQTFTFEVKDANGVVATPTITFGTGETSKSVTLIGLAPGTYTVSEIPAAPWLPLPDASVAIDLPQCSASVDFANAFGPASARAIKVSVPAGNESGWEMTLNGPGTPAGGEKVVTDGSGLASFTTALQEGSYTIAETAKPGFDQTGSSGCSFTVDYPADADRVFTCTITNTQRGSARVIKTVGGLAPTQAPGSGFLFQLRQGAVPAYPNGEGTILETAEANSSNGGAIAFSTLLVPGQTYQLCEVIMPGWTTTLVGFVPNSVGNPTVDNSPICVDFTVQPGETVTFTVDNTPPPGGRALTIGFWKNWASCASSNGKQKPVLDDTLASFAIALGQLTPGVFIGDLYVDTCTEAVRILNKSTVDTNKKMASDPAYNLAAQLLAAKLNVQAGAGVCPAALTAISQAQSLLDTINFTGTGAYAAVMTAAQKTLANSLAASIDKYNNNALC